MGTGGGAWIIPLNEAVDVPVTMVGGKAAVLGRLAGAGLPVARGVCLTVLAYESFITEGGLADVIRMELGRKSLDSMRWEELWDAALRIRSAFLTAPIPDRLAGAIRESLGRFDGRRPLAVRSSAPGEDSASRSFAGLHESVVGVAGADEVLTAVRVVWASLWSDAALLYRKELSLDPSSSRMAVLIQEMVSGEASGVAFARDPRDQTLDREIIEAVPGPCGNLVDGLVDPDRWILRHSSGEVLTWKGGERESTDTAPPLLETHEVSTIHGTLNVVEQLLGWPPDLEWTDGHAALTVLQARPITSGSVRDGEDARTWYLTLRPTFERLRALATRVADVLIPELSREAARLAGDELEAMTDDQLARAIEHRHDVLQHWRGVYHDEFIPFAHGVRYLGAYYNDAVRPDDPYEFLGLLRGERFLAAQRNEEVHSLAKELRAEPGLLAALERCGAGSDGVGPTQWRAWRETVGACPGGPGFVDRLEQIARAHFDTAFGDARLADRPDLLVSLVTRLARASDGVSRTAPVETQALEERLYAGVGPARRKEASDVLAIGRLSWRLRDDDNVLMGRLEGQLLLGLAIGAARLRARGRLEGDGPGEAQAGQVAEALRGHSTDPVMLGPRASAEAPGAGAASAAPRQLIGQPASPGLATGPARIVRTAEDLGRFHAGDVLVCDAIQPTMTQVVPLAAAIVERRGGMLIHGAIIARELGIPCVNGVARVTDLVTDGEALTVDGHLGIVSVGAPEFDLETAGPTRAVATS